MPPFFTLRQVVSQTRARPADVLNVKRALNRMGFYDVPDYGMTPYPDGAMFEGIQRFQRANGLRVDGVMQRGHATERAMNDALRRTSAERREGPKPSQEDSQRIKDLKAELNRINERIKGVEFLMRRAGEASNPFAALIIVKEKIGLVEERKKIEAELSRLKGGK
ncbi:MAG: peptidoglycan-binding protein [Proteobacteria bacterium]|nr:peptidoglycan-binding protein [Pseudomonadota bacterium]